MTAKKKNDEMDELLANAEKEGEEIGDDEVDIDLSEAISFAPFTAKVPVEISTATRKNSKPSAANGNRSSPYIECKLRVFEGEFEKRVLFFNINLTGKGAGFGFDALTAFGADIGDPKKPRISISKLIGLRAFAQCAPDKREEYKHKVVVGRITTYVSADDEEDDEVK